MAAALRPSSPVVLVNLGMALLENGDGEGALPVLRRAIALDARTATAHLNLGNALSRSFPDGRSLGLQLRLQQVRVSTRRNGCNDFPLKNAAASRPVAA